MSEGKELGARELLERFGLIPEEDVAALFGISVKTLKNRARANLPQYVKAGRRRLFVEESVREYLNAKRARYCFGDWVPAPQRRQSSRTGPGR